MIVFTLSEKEEKEYRKWSDLKNKRYKKLDQKVSYTFCFTPTGIGNSIAVKCSDGTEKDITDYDSW